jgi:hypothetical protein
MSLLDDLLSFRLQLPKRGVLKYLITRHNGNKNPKLKILDLQR